MKKIAELHIGANVPDYNEYGSPTLFINYTEADKFKWSDYWKGVLQAYCDYCHRMFIINRSDSFNKYETITCPSCGMAHKHNKIMYSSDSYGILPYKIRMTLIEFKGKIELRLKYQGICFNDDIFGKYQHFDKVYEKYIFDVTNDKVSWQRQVKNEHLEYEIGYFNEDFKILKNKSALCFFQYDHKIKKGDSFTSLLKKLREAVNRLEKRKGYQSKGIYVYGKRKTHLFTSVLNIAHRVRFWDMENITFIDHCEYEKILNSNAWDVHNLDMTLVDFWRTQGYNFQESICKAFNLPYIKTVRKNLQLGNLSAIINAFKIPSINLAWQAYNYFKNNNVSVREQNECVEVFNCLYKKYPKLTFDNMQKKYREYYDTFRLLGKMDKATNELYEKSNVPLRKLHDWLSIKVASQKGRERIYNIPDYIINRLNMQLGYYKLETITKSSQVVAAAINLKNCSARYIDDINSKLQLVVITDENGKMRALLEIQSNCIIQAKLFDNDKVFLNKEINKIILEFAKKAELQIKTNDIKVYDIEKISA